MPERVAAEFDVVGIGNADPYVAHEEAIRGLGTHLGIPLERSRCYPYGR